MPRRGIASTQAWSSLLVRWPPSRGSLISGSGSIGSRHLQEDHEPWLGFSSLEINQSNPSFEVRGGKKHQAKQICVVHKLGQREPPKVTPCLCHCLVGTKSRKGKKTNKHVLIIFNSISPFYGLQIS